MALFFFLLEIEIKRELLAGELKDAWRAVPVIAAALGGMIMPALIYFGMTKAAIWSGDAAFFRLPCLPEGWVINGCAFAAESGFSLDLPLCTGFGVVPGLFVQHLLAGGR